MVNNVDLVDAITTDKDLVQDRVILEGIDMKPVCVPVGGFT
jgi:hypothetical protein